MSQRADIITRRRCRLFCAVTAGMYSIMARWSRSMIMMTRVARAPLRVYERAEPLSLPPRAPVLNVPATPAAGTRRRHDDIRPQRCARAKVIDSRQQQASRRARATLREAVQRERRANIARTTATTNILFIRNGRMMAAHMRARRCQPQIQEEEEAALCVAPARTPPAKKRTWHAARRARALFGAMRVKQARTPRRLAEAAAPGMARQRCFAGARRASDACADNGAKVAATVLYAMITVAGDARTSQHGVRRRRRDSH